jgi:hypothetical protein
MNNSSYKISLALSVVFGFIALPIPLTEVQVSKNRAQLKNMKDRVEAVKDFYENSSRFPTNEELRQISQTLPDRYGLNPDYWLDTSPEEHNDGWELSFWRGDDKPRYTSWDNHYTLSESLSWRVFWGPLWWPLISSGLLSLVLLLMGLLLKPRKHK